MELHLLNTETGGRIPRQLWSHPGTMIFEDGVGILLLESWVHLYVWLEKWRESLWKEGEFSLDGIWVHAWPVWGPFFGQNQIRFWDQRDLRSKSSSDHIPCAL